MAEELRRRVREGRQGNQTGGGGNGTVAVEGPTKALISAVREMEPQYAIAIGNIRGATADQLVRDATTLIRRTPKLAECAQATVLGGLMNFAQLGLRVATPLGHGWLIPMWSTRNHRMEATTVIGYKGYTKLAYNAGALRDVRARTICMADEWSVEYGTREEIVHRPQYNPELGGRGRPVGYYCVVNMVRGGQVFHFRTHEEMEDHRDSYAMAREYEWIKGKRGPVKRYPEDHPMAGRPMIVGPWRDFFEPMAHKTEWLACAKYVPMSADLELAVAGDSTVRMDLNPRNRDAIVGDRPDEVTVWDSDAVDESEDAERETINVTKAAPPEDERADSTPAAAGAAPDEEGPAPGAAAEDPPASAAAPQRQAVIREFMAVMHQCGTGGDEACLVVAAALTGVTPVPGSLSGFTDEQLVGAVLRLREMRAEGEEARQTTVLALLPAENSPIWDQVATARREHEDAKRPSARRRKAAEKEET